MSYQFTASAGKDGRLPPRLHLGHSAEVEATLREVDWRIARLSRTPTDRQPAWTTGIRMTLHEALANTHAAGTACLNASPLILAAAICSIG